MPTDKTTAGPARRRIAANIKRLRTAGGWSIGECADYAGVGESTWRSWENGHRGPDVDRLDAIAACLGVTPADLVS